MNALQNFFKTFFLTELLKGLALTGGYVFQRKITVQFPEEKTPISPRFRGLHAALRRDTKMAKERCISVQACAKGRVPGALPSRSRSETRADAIHAVPRATTST